MIHDRARVPGRQDPFRGLVGLMTGEQWSRYERWLIIYSLHLHALHVYVVPREC